ncbi:MAG: SDR family NAD(P)-dependent oxidoreductase [Eubacterium sp.]|nr:SDR family NAD(P)-dependent oxidoreductase [Eubacterium sp.]
MKTVLLTGVSGGIGEAIAKKLLEQNYFVLGVSYTNRDFGKCLEESAPNFKSYQCDLSDFDAAQALLEQIHQDGYSLDYLINNAGVSIVGLLQDLTRSDWEFLWNTNVTSALALSRAAISDFLSKGSGKIINISSVWGNNGASCEVAYSATKGALNTFTKALAKELAPSNIQVNALACGIIDTKMNAHLSQADLDAIIDEIPAGRIGTPEDIADAVSALLQSGNYLTGQIISVDGGWTV